jgi:predicted alpha/beta hydrolase
MNRSGLKKKEKLKSTACCVFGCFAGHRRRRETEKRKMFPIHQFVTFISGGA